jgi:hypothetical protein
MVQEVHPIFSDRTINDFETLILIDHPKVSNKRAADEQLEELRELETHFDVQTVTSSPNPITTLERIRDKQGSRPDKSAVAPATGDGSSEGAVLATLGNGALFWKLHAGNSDNIGRASFQRWNRGNPSYIYRHGKIARTKPIECAVTDSNGNTKYSFVVLDEVGFGDTGAASEALNAQDHRDYRETLGKIGRKVANAKVSSEAIKLAKPFSIKWGNLDSISPEDTRTEEQYRELLYANLGYIADGWVRGISMTDPKMVELSNQRSSRFSQKLFFGRLYANLLSGEDIPDGEDIDFDIVKPTIMQKSGDHFNVATGDHVHIARSLEEVLVFSTRRRP